jgi:hypothetical protein
MKSMFERAALDEVVRRIDSLNAGSQHLWGKMGVAQMLAHCSVPPSKWPRGRGPSGGC